MENNTMHKHFVKEMLKGFAISRSIPEPSYYGLFHMTRLYFGQHIADELAMLTDSEYGNICIRDDKQYENFIKSI